MKGIVTGCSLQMRRHHGKSGSPVQRLHRPDPFGPENAPRIAAQREDDLVKALREYKSNVRRGCDAAMADVMHPITDADILDLAYFLARVR